MIQKSRKLKHCDAHSFHNFHAYSLRSKEKWKFQKKRFAKLPRKTKKISIGLIWQKKIFQTVTNTKAKNLWHGHIFCKIFTQTPSFLNSILCWSLSLQMYILKVKQTKKKKLDVEKDKRFYLINLFAKKWITINNNNFWQLIIMC